MASHGYVRLAWHEWMFEPPNKGDGTILEHREICAQRLGRRLRHGETVHHINENKKDNRSENLMVFRTIADHGAYHAGGKLVDHGDGTFSTIKIGKKKEREQEARRQARVLAGLPPRSRKRRPPEAYICSCGVPKNPKSKVCMDCRLRSVAAASNCPSKEILEKLVWQMPTTKVALEYGVSDKAVEKWCKKYDIEKPPRGYWAKQYSKLGKSV